MASQIEGTIRAEAAKLIRRHEMYMSNLAAEMRRRSARSGLASQKTILTPAHWSVATGFNPYHVRKHAKAIARSLERQLAARQYAPTAPTGLGNPFGIFHTPAARRLIKNI